MPGSYEVWRGVRGLPTRLVLHGAVVTALISGATAFIASDKALTVTIDGKPKHIHTFASTVGGVLDEEGITVGQRDVVAPGLDAKVTDGTRIAVRYGRLISVNVDGKDRTVWVTALNVQEALDQLGIRDSQAFVSVSRSSLIGREGLEFDVRLPRSVKLTVEGKSRKIQTTAATAGDAVEAAGVPLGKRDLVLPGREAYPDEGDHIRVFKITGKVLARSESIAYRTRTVADGSMYEGEEKVTQTGKNGVRKVRYEYVWKGGKWVLKRELVATTLTKPVSRVVRVGTKDRPVSTGGGGGSGSGLNWAALAECESGGNPRAVSPNGLYFGLYQFALGTWESVGGSGNPIDASPAEQTHRAQILYDQAGDGPWPVCGSRLYT